MNKFAQSFRATLVLALVGLLGLEPVLAETPGAMLTPTGSTTVNGRAIPGNAAIFSGDVLSVTSGNAVLRPKQFVALLDQSTIAVFDEKDGKDSIEFKRGSGTVMLADKNASVKYLGLTVTPLTKNSKVVIGLEHGRPAIMASNGPLLLTKGTATMMLDAGSAIVQNQSPTQNDVPVPGQAPATGTDQPPATPPADNTVPPPPAATAAQPTRDNDDFCSEENQSKDKKRRKKCGAPAAAFTEYHVIRDAIVVAAILALALWEFGAFENNKCATPTAPNQTCQ